MAPNAERTCIYIVLYTCTASLPRNMTGMTIPIKAHINTCMALCRYDNPQYLFGIILSHDCNMITSHSMDKFTHSLQHIVKKSFNTYFPNQFPCDLNISLLKDKYCSIRIICSLGVFRARVGAPFEHYRNMVAIYCKYILILPEEKSWFEPIKSPSTIYNS